VTAARSKTIKDKNGKTITYSKSIKDGKKTSKTTTGTATGSP